MFRVSLDFNKIGQSVYGLTPDGNTTGGGFDSIADWRKSSEVFGFNPGTLGPLSVARAAVAQFLNGDRISTLSVSAFDLSADGHLHFKDLENNNANNDDVAFWLTNTQGQTKLYLYKMISIDYGDDNEIINNLHAFLGRISEPGHVLQLQKAIPKNLFDYTDTRRLLAPPVELVKAVVCDVQGGYRDISQPVFLSQETMQQQTIPLQPISSPSPYIGPLFGYGQKVFIYRPA